MRTRKTAREQAEAALKGPESGSGEALDSEPVADGGEAKASPDGREAPPMRRRVFPPRKPITEEESAAIDDLFPDRGSLADQPPRQARRMAPSATVELPPEDVPERQRSVGSDSNRRVSALRVAGYEKIIDSLFTFDPDVAIEEVVSALRFERPASSMEYGVLVDALDDAQETFRKSLQLVAHARVTLANYKSDVEVILAELRDQAVTELTKTKAKPTIADIDAHMRSVYHDEYRDSQEKINKAKETITYLEGLSKAAGERARDIRQMVAGSRGA